MTRTVTDGPTRTTLFMRWAALVGDFGNPFYGEERQRDVWNEASALGLQLSLWLTLVLIAVMTWTGTAMPFALALLGILGVTSLVTVTYAHRLGVDVYDGQRLLRARMVPYLAILAVIGAGLLRSPHVTTSWRLGLVVGFLVGTVVAVAAATLGRRRKA
jgi:hypothetical protein